VALLDSTPNYYDILGVKSTASLDEIRRRYKFLVIAFHPDRFLRTPEHHALAEQRIKQVNEAYRILADPQSRTQYDLLRLSLLPHAGSPVTIQPYLAQVQQEAAYAQARSRELEQELAAARKGLDAAAEEKSSLLQEQSRREQGHQQERLAMEAEVERLTHQLEQLVRERLDLDGKLKEQQRRANKKTAQLSQELANQERLVENLAATKADWEKSTQTRYDLLLQQVRKLQDDVKQRDALLMQQRQVQHGLEERLANAEQEARQAVHVVNASLRSKQAEFDALQAENRRAAEAQVHARKSVRLWQIATAIAIVNTLVLLGLLLWAQA
jgi:curved DNA-binding protein CbpA